MFDNIILMIIKIDFCWNYDGVRILSESKRENDYKEFTGDSVLNTSVHY